MKINAYTHMITKGLLGPSRNVPEAAGIVECNMPNHPSRFTNGGTFHNVLSWGRSVHDINFHTALCIEMCIHARH